MKAVLYQNYGSPDVIRIEEVEKPVPRDDEILVKIQATVVTQADCAFRQGKPFLTRFFTGLTRPKSIPGDVLAGEVEAVGKAVRWFKAGDSVFGSSGPGFGAHAEYKCLSDKEALAVKPSPITPEAAVALYDGVLTALPFLRDKARLQGGQSVLINGASGSVGTAAVQVAKYFGADVTGVCSTANVELVKSLGADQVIDYTSEDFTRTGRTYDIIFDAVGKSSFSRCKKVLKPQGIYLSTVLGLGIILQMIRTSITGGRKAVITFAGLRPSAEKQKDLLLLTELIKAEKLKPVIDKVYPLHQIAEAHRYVDQGHKKGNVVITLNHLH